MFGGRARRCLGNEMVKKDSVVHNSSTVEETITSWTDHYFLSTKKIVQKFGDNTVTYAVFMRRPVISAPRLIITWLQEVAKLRETHFDIECLYPEGDWVGAGEPILYITGSFAALADLETLFLQKLGPVCVAAFNAYIMCSDLPNVDFIAMDARHCAGLEMTEMMAYAASVGSEAAKRTVGAKGFIGNATAATAKYFGRSDALGTMPHALIGYAGSTLKAVKMFHQMFPQEPLTALVDYFGCEITDSLEVCKHFGHLITQGRLSIRLDTPGSRFMEGLDQTKSYTVLDQFAPQAIRGYRTEAELKYLVGAGVSVASIFHLRQALDQHGFHKVKIVGSSGFDPLKCKVMADAKAPIDVIGTGSYLPQVWTETYATADIIEYNGQQRVKLGREFLFRKKN